MPNPTEFNGDNQRKAFQVQTDSKLATNNGSNDANGNNSNNNNNNDNRDDDGVEEMEGDAICLDPPLLLLRPIEWRLSRLTEAAKHLAKIKQMKVVFDRSWGSAEIWHQAMVCFENHKNYGFAFVQSLAGYSSICSTDRAILFTNSLFPIVVAQLSLDYDLEKHEENFLSMDSTGKELMARYFRPIADLGRHFHDAGVAIKNSSLTAVEFSLLAALLFFNPEVPNLVAADKVREVEDEYRHAASVYLTQIYGKDALLERLGVLASLVHYFSRLADVHLTAMAEMANQFPSLLKVNVTHYEMFTKSFQTSVVS